MAPAPAPACGTGPGIAPSPACGRGSQARFFANPPSAACGRGGQARLRARALAHKLSIVVTALLATAPALAQTPAPGSAPPAGLPTDVRYTPVNGAAPLLYPRTPGQDDAPGAVLTSALNFAANGAIARLVVEVDRDAVPADGQSPVQLKVTVLGADGQPLRQTVFLTLEHSAGRILLPGARTDEFGPRALDADRTTPGIQLKVDGGMAQFTLLAPDQAQDVRIRVSAGSQQAAGVVSFVPELRPMVAAGLVEGIVNFRGGGLQPVQRGDVFEREIQAWSRSFNNGKSDAAARSAFYLKGTVRGDVLLTAAYDSDKDTRARLLRDIRPDEVYPVYGDASLRSIDARSGSKLFVRVDKNKSYLLWGDLVTGDGFSQAQGQGAVASLKQRSLGQYNRTATGLRAHHEQDGLTGNAFAFNDSLRQVVQEFASQGSGPYGLRNSGVIEGSEKVEVVVRDRFQTARIVSVRPLARLVDYSFEPFSGRILLSQFLPSVDAQLNPVSLRVTYELDQGGQAFWVAGADVQWAITPALEVGGAAVLDRNALAPYDLASANATLRLGPRTALVAEVARSQSTVNTNPTNQNNSAALATRTGQVSGQAWRVELAHEGDRADGRLFVGRSAPEFNNIAAPLNGGRGEARLAGGYKLTDDLKLQADALASEDRNPGGGRRSSAGAGLQWLASDRLTLSAGLRQASETVGTQGNGLLTAPFGDTAGLSGSLTSGAAGGALGYGNQALDPATGLPVIGQGGLAAALTGLPAGTRLSSRTLQIGAGWRATDRLTLGAQLEGDVSGDARRRVSLGGDFQLAERTKIYGRYERQSGWVQLAGITGAGSSANALVFGIDSTYLRDTQVFSEYRLRDAISGRDAQVASGVRQGIDIAEGWRASLGYEQIQVMAGNTAKAQAVTAGLDYSADPLWRGSTRVEHRRSGDMANTPGNDRFGTTLWQLMAARKLDRDWTLLARNYLLYTDYAARGDVLQDRAQIGLAWRPVDHNRFNALAKIEHKRERDASNSASNAVVGDLQTRAWIASAHGDWHPARPWWLTGRLAAKWQTDRLELGTQDSFRAQLAAGRLVYDITERWDIGALAAVQWGQRGARQQAAGIEAGFLLQQNLWLSAGFNVSGFRGDADLVGYEYTQRGGYLRLRLKFDETLFRSGDGQTHRSLDRSASPP